MNITNEQRIKGAFYTPAKWAIKAVEYLNDYLGDDWQDKYIIWDCAAGTGNLLVGLNNKNNIWASTLDNEDVDILMTKDNLNRDQCFQFDFLNDDFNKLPQKLYHIIKTSPEKIVMFINPPYVEMANNGKILNKRNVSFTNIKNKYFEELGNASNEVFCQFLMRIYKEIPNCIIGEFSKLKILQAPNFRKMCETFKSKLESGFIVPSWTFDNVKGKFPIGFKIWNCNKKEVFKKIVFKVFDENEIQLENKIINTDNKIFLSDWLKNFKTKENRIGMLRGRGNGFQEQKLLRIQQNNSSNDVAEINENNLKQVAIYYAVRHAINADWLNDRDQFL